MLSRGSVCMSQVTQYITQYTVRALQPPPPDCARPGGCARCAVRGAWRKQTCVVRRLGDKARSGLGEGEMLEYQNIRIICCCSTSCFQLTDERLLAVLAAAARATGCLHAGWPPHLPRLPSPAALPAAHNIC